MGTDIEIHAEQRDRGVWHHIDRIKPHFRRNYLLFGILGLGYPDWTIEEPVVPYLGRGVPDDASPQTAARYEIWKGDAHGMNWLSLPELLAHWFSSGAAHNRGYLTSADTLFSKMLLDLQSCGIHEDCLLSPELAKACLTDMNDVRLIYWFDN